ncbi:sulfite reductase subunit beta (hemoprotein) [Candidatus Marinamargulisbacteria bacterium SCGC AG-343-D04]|nr:sulfite reductase subunit beta (hemoprotein) [Candidatus Marinamargulisbacteria bacterium SCGC AG-343-D04]
MKFYENAPTLIAEQDQFEKDMIEFAGGAINPIKFKAIRVAHGVYEQRQEHTYMIRIRCAAGGITPKQLKKVAELGEKYGSSEVHFTTRQEVQVHDVLLQDVIKVIRGLNEVDLSSRGGGGNTIRNILTSPLSGIEEGEVFDVDPYAISLTTRMINEPDSWNLPRKFKIALSNSDEDTAYTQATCLGFVAAIKEGQKGFRVYCAGGMGAKPMVGHELIDFIPENRVYHVTKAIKIMFDKHGNRRSKYSSRIKFLWKKLDRNEFLKLFYEEYDQVKDDDSLNLDIHEIVNEGIDPQISVESVDSVEFELWKKRYVSAQKQEGLSTIKMPLCLGDLESKDAYVLCDFLDQFGDNTIRCDRAQNMRIRNIPSKYIGNLYNIVKSMSHTLVEHAPFIANMINCTGAQTCKLGICLPRGLSTELRDKLMHSDLNLDAIPEFRLNMSGCPNTCGMHHIADLGFFGKIGRKEGKIYPAYNILAGAKVGAGKTEYASKVSDLPAHAVPEFVYRFLKHYIEEKEEYSSYHEYLEKEGVELIKEISAELKEVPLFEEDQSCYIDFGAKRPLRLDDMGAAECSAGMFDMINVDRKQMETRIKGLDDVSDVEEELYRILFHTSRMLLVTRGLDASNEQQAFAYFEKHFVQTELVDISNADLLQEAKKGQKSYLKENKQRVIKLAEDVMALYKSMDDSLRFKQSPKQNVAEEKDVVESIKKDYRGVACPMNFVKTKLVLETMSVGQQLEILLDNGAPIENVPNSVKLEGHSILRQEQSSEGHWSVLIKKN